MKLADTLARLSEERREQLMAHPLIQAGLQGGGTLEAALGGADWARRWSEAADPLCRKLLLRLVRRYAGLPFGAEEAETRLLREGEWTGAEIRVALARLRRDGILFAVRKAWGERLLYLPSDTVALWQLALRAPKEDATTDGEAVGNAPARPMTGLPEEGLFAEADEAEVEFNSPDSSDASDSSIRLPFSLELLRFWADIRSGGFPLTAKGAPNRSRVAKLAEAMSLRADEVEAANVWPQADPAVPANAALALDLGLCLGWLIREPGRLAAADQAPEDWTGLNLAAAEAKLLDIAAARYAGQEAALHWAAVALRGMQPYEWFPAGEALRQWDGEPEPDDRERESLDRWTRLLAALGWMERRTSQGVMFLRWRMDPAYSQVPSQPPDAAIYVQPDLEVIVPPEASFGDRWLLELIAERVSLDVVSTYRVTRSSCVRAGEAGYTRASVSGWLEDASGAPLPEPAARALEDWFGRIGRLSIADAKLLRAESAELADLIARDGRSSVWLLERLGERAFLVKPEGERELAKRLNDLGYPLAEQREQASAENSASKRRSAAKPAADGAAEASSAIADSGWMRLRKLLAIYEPDHSIPEREELFPGMESIPSVWLQQPRSYHPSTRRELIERALAWRTGLRVKCGDRWLDFIPEALTANEGGWEVEGRIRSSLPGESAQVVWRAERLGELMIELPDGAAGQPRTNH